VGDSFVPLVSRRSRIGNDSDRSVAKAPEIDMREGRFLRGRPCRIYEPVTRVTTLHALVLRPNAEE
jgi:hypothetical protein